MCKLILLILFYNCLCHNVNNKLTTVFSWKQIEYDFNGVKYTKDSNYERSPNVVVFDQELEDFEKFFIQYNNVPIGLEVYKDIVFVTVPRRRHGIPSTLNYVDFSSSSPKLKPYPDVESRKDLVSVYRPRVDSCNRLWMVDTGLYEVPNARTQIQKPAVVIYDLTTNKRILKQELSDEVIVSERTTGGLTSIIVDISTCDDAFAYINDLATNGLIVFSLRSKESWRIDHESFRHDPRALNFTAAGYVITWPDGLFSISLADTENGRKVFYHSLASNEEYAIDTQYLKSKVNNATENVQLVGTRGPNSQSGSHAYHSGSRTFFFANVANDAISCWNIDKKMTPENFQVITRDDKYLAYISDLKVIGDEVWVLVNNIPRFALAAVDPRAYNFFVHKAYVRDLIKGTNCE